MSTYYICQLPTPCSSFYHECNYTDFWGNGTDEPNDDYVGDDDEERDEEVTVPSRTRTRRVVFDDDDEEEEEDEPFNTPESSGERSIFITQRDPEEYHEPGTLSAAQKGKTPARRKRASTTNVWAGFGLSAEVRPVSSTTPPAKKRGTTTRGKSPRGKATRGRGTHGRGKRGTAVARHIYFE